VTSEEIFNGALEIKGKRKLINNKRRKAPGPCMHTEEINSNKIKRG